ncbi:MAG: diguanylate cyclase [Gammaproteobacteria bacterium]|nr:diguanylate cyclase [Gammaproteobacteria bacterium]
MTIVSRILGPASGKSRHDTPVAAGSVTDGALDTLGSVIRVMGDESFPLDSDLDGQAFRAKCSEFARHVEHGAAVPSCGIPQSPDSNRDWARVRRFFADRRHAEKAFVGKRLQDYRSIVDDFVSSLRGIGERDESTETTVRDGLEKIQAAVDIGALADIKNALSETLQNVGDTFSEQKREYEKRLEELNDRMSSLRQDLVAAREEMKRDALTDAFNRGAFDASIKNAVNMHYVLRQPFTLIMTDIDHFKQVNDERGHTAGDAALRAVSDCLARTFIRKSDLVCRYGGDEFAIILTDTAAGDARRLIERFMKSAREIRLPAIPGEQVVTCSVGYTEIVDSDTVESLVNRADQALYRAKAAGRDGSAFVASDEAPPQPRTDDGIA